MLLGCTEYSVVCVLFKAGRWGDPQSARNVCNPKNSNCLIKRLQYKTVSHHRQQMISKERFQSRALRQGMAAVLSRRQRYRVELTTHESIDVDFFDTRLGPRAGACMQQHRSCCSSRSFSSVQRKKKGARSFLIGQFPDTNVPAFEQQTTVTQHGAPSTARNHENTKDCT